MEQTLETAYHIFGGFDDPAKFPPALALEYIREGILST